MRHTELFEKHKAVGAKLVEFHGWEMPLEYSGVISEHKAVRRAAGLFDVSHMGTIEVGGSDSLAFLRKMLPFRPETLEVDRARYAFLLNPAGGIKDDLIVFHLNEERFLLVVNASNTEKDLEWLRANAAGFDAVVVDDSPDTSILALQGPASWDIVKKALGVDPTQIKYHAFINSEFEGTGYILSKTGYTGEKGFEIYIHRHTVGRMWDALMDAGSESGLLPCGLGARDTLRLEMGYLLYGNDIDEETNPLQAGYAGVLDFENTEFIGREPLARLKDDLPEKRLSGLMMTGKGIPRHGSLIRASGLEAGVVTSGNYSPSLRIGIALGYLKTGTGTEDITIEVHGKRFGARVAEYPFYKRK